MPLTPLHTGPPGLLAIWFERRIDIVAAVLGSALVDIDFFIGMAAGSGVHGFLHTFAGALALGIVLAGGLHILRERMDSVRSFFGLEEGLAVGGLAAGSLLGTLSHVLLDGLIYSDMEPCYPASGNRLYLGSSSGLDFAIVYGIAAATTVLLILVYYRKYATKMA